MNFEKGFNIIYGDNAQGKTNILEAMILCSLGRSHRTTKDVELIKFGKDAYSVRVGFKKNETDKNIEILYSKEEKRRIRINEIPLKKIAGLIGQLNAVMFSPEDMIMIKEGPSERRRFVDMALSQLRPSYFYDLQQYIKILNQRNNLLKEIEYKKSLIDTLEVWDQSLTEMGSRIIKARKEFIDILSRRAEDNHSKITNCTEKLLIRYSPSVNGIENYNDLKHIKNIFLNRLESLKKKELMKCTTLIGPQRDEYEYFVNKESLKLYGSQGQQRTAVLSVKLSEIEIIKEEMGESPVLLLDDVMSELDNKRQEYLFKHLRGIQVFITCTEKESIERGVGEDANYIKIKEGKVMN
jgi:DNA replication and repair protein RecF